MTKVIIAVVAGTVMGVISWLTQDGNTSLPFMDGSMQAEEPAEETTTVDLEAMAIVINPDGRPDPNDAVIVTQGPNLIYGAYKHKPTSQTGCYGQCGCRGNQCRVPVQPSRQYQQQCCTHTSGRYYYGRRRWNFPVIRFFGRCLGFGRRRCR